MARRWGSLIAKGERKEPLAQHEGYVMAEGDMVQRSRVRGARARGRKEQKGQGMGQRGDVPTGAGKPGQDGEATRL